MSPNTDLIESVKENSEKAENYNMKPSNSTCQCHIGYQHRQSAYYRFSHAHLCDIRTIQSPKVCFDTYHEVRSIPQEVVIIIVSQSNPNPEAFYNKVVLDRKN